MLGTVIAVTGTLGSDTGTLGSDTGTLGSDTGRTLVMGSTAGLGVAVGSVAVT